MLACPACDCYSSRLPGLSTTLRPPNTLSHCSLASCPRQLHQDTVTMASAVLKDIIKLEVRENGCCCVGFAAGGEIFETRQLCLDHALSPPSPFHRRTRQKSWVKSSPKSTRQHSSCARTGRSCTRGGMPQAGGRLVGAQLHALSAPSSCCPTTAEGLFLGTTHKLTVVQHTPPALLPQAGTGDGQGPAHSGGA